MDVETSEAIERLTGRIDALEISLRAEFRTGLADTHSSLRAEFRAGFAELRDELKDEILESRRHAQVLFESTRDDIRMIADAVALISARLDTRS
jgi:hypothetical protein